jgi:hypothetical protein
MARPLQRILVVSVLGALMFGSLWISLRASGQTSRPLQRFEKEAILAADGGNPPCGQVLQLNCGAIDNNGNFTGCGKISFPGCGGQDCTNACTNTDFQTWQCPKNNLTPYQCPNLINDPVEQSCGIITTGGSCTGTQQKGCYCAGGTPVNPTQQCGNTNLQPNPPYPTCTTGT